MSGVIAIYDQSIFIISETEFKKVSLKTYTCQYTMLIPSEMKI